MYKEIFKNGVNDKSLKAAGEYAKEVVKSFIENRVWFYPTKSDSYDGKKFPVEFCINDEIGHYPNPNLPSFGIGWTGNPKYIGGIDLYDINDKESKGSLKYK